jgi:adenine-specific DNA-methyltransferase
VGLPIPLAASEYPPQEQSVTEQPERISLAIEGEDDRRIAALRDLLPEAFIEGRPDLARLGEALGLSPSTSSEGYNVSWDGKADAQRALQMNSTATLRPDLKASTNFPDAEHVFVEGDNLEVLRLLQRGYNDRVRMIYIDPPYNTGKDFVYEDNYRDGLAEYLAFTGQVDEDGKRLSSKANTSGRYHSAWLSMMYPRLALARNLLTSDGVIFVSIDDNEVHNLRLLMNDVFGEENFIATLIWKSKSGGANDSEHFAVDHEYILVFARRKAELRLNDDPAATVTTSYSREDENGAYALERLDKQNLQYSASMDYDLIGPDGTVYRLNHKDPASPNATWRWSKAKVEECYDSLVFDNGHVYTKNYKKDAAIARSLLIEERFGRTRSGSSALRALVPGNVFDNPKPPSLLKHLINIATNPGDIVLDFFAGSGSTADAVMQVNRENPDLAARRFIAVQLPEALAEDSRAYRQGYRTLSEITLDRINKAAEALHSTDRPGLRVLRLAVSNFKVWDPDAAPVEGDALARQVLDFADSLASDATDEGIVVEMLLKEGVRLDALIEETTLLDQPVFAIGDLAVCTAHTVTPNLVTALIDFGKPRLVLLDSAFAGDDQTKSNAYFRLRDASIALRTI